MDLTPGLSDVPSGTPKSTDSPSFWSPNNVAFWFDANYHIATGSLITVGAQKWGAVSGEMVNALISSVPWRGEGRRLAGALAIGIVLAAINVPSSRAGGIIATVTDERGQPLPDAVVSIVASGNTRIAPSDQLATATIDQLEETFVPTVAVVRRGGSVVFHNSDRTRHHIYSFSPIRQFEFVQKPDDNSPAVSFDVPGVAAIGCNIHDSMIAYVYVTDAPRAAVTDKLGRAEITDLPAGSFIATVWHPRLRPKAVPPPLPVSLESSSTNLAITIAVLPPRRARNPKNPY
jgi:plastocyanin